MDTAPAPDWTATNLVGVPPGLIGSAAFNAHPVDLQIAGTRASARGLFDLLEASGTLARCAQVFEHFLEISFGLAQPPVGGAGRRRWRTSYRKLLEGWGFDSNAPPAAVLKSWVQSRFGLVPTFHGGRLGRYPSAAWINYIEQKHSSRYHGNCIDLQLDLLYEYCQWAARRHFAPGWECIAAWRGIDADEAEGVSSGSLREGQALLRMNNVVSFSLSRAHAEPFGDWIVEAHVPVQKLLFFPGLLGHSILAGEGELIALGGDYEVRASYW